MATKYRVYHAIGYDEFTAYEKAVEHHAEKGISEIETIEYEIPTEGQI